MVRSAPLLPQFYQPKLKYGSNETEHVMDPSDHLLRRESGRMVAPLTAFLAWLVLDLVLGVNVNFLTMDNTGG